MRRGRSCQTLTRAPTGFNVWQQPTAIAVDITAPKGRVGTVLWAPLVIIRGRASHVPERESGETVKS